MLLCLISGNNLISLQREIIHFSRYLSEHQYRSDGTVIIPEGYSDHNVYELLRLYDFLCIPGHIICDNIVRILKKTMDSDDIQSFLDYRENTKHSGCYCCKRCLSFLLNRDNLFDIIDYAEYANEAGIDILLRSHRANKENDDEALIRACMNGHTLIVKKLVEQGANPIARDNEPIIWASANGHTHTVNYLYYICEANPTAQNNQAIIWASRNGHFSTVSLLVSIGADISAQNNLALVYAKAMKRDKVIKYIEELCS